MQTEFSEQETRSLIAQLKQDKGDSFRIRVMRRIPGQVGPQVLASFDEASADHIANPERWLPELAGGGNYILHIFHRDDGLKQIGGGIPLVVDNMQARSVNIPAVMAAEWSGPRAMSYPKPRPQNGNGNGSTHIDARGEIGVDIDPRRGATPLPPAGVMQLGSQDPTTWALEQAQKAERQLAEERRRSEIEGIRRESESRLKEAENRSQRMLDEMRALRESNAKPVESTMESLTKALAPLVPILQTLITANNDNKLKMLEIQQQTAQAQLAASRESAEKIDKLLTAMISKPAVDPVMLELIKGMFAEKKEHPIVAETMSAMTTMMQGTLQVITAATDAGILGNRDNEGGTGEIVKEVARAAGAAFEAFSAAKATAPVQIPVAAQRQPPVRRLPQGQQPQPQPRRLTPFQRLDAMIKAHHNVSETARYFLDGIGQESDLRKAFLAAGQDIEIFFRTHWEQWAASNLAAHGPYVQALHGAVIAEAQKRGLIPAATPEPEPVPAPAAPLAAVAVADDGDPEFEPENDDDGVDDSDGLLDPASLLEPIDPAPEAGLR